MNPMSNVSMCNHILVAHLCHPMPYAVFWTAVQKILANPSQTQVKYQGVSSHAFLPLLL
jgi:hypothetical protein